MRRYRELEEIIESRIQYGLNNNSKAITFDFYYLYSIYRFKTGEYQTAYEHSQKAMDIFDGKGEEKITGESVPGLLLIYSKTLDKLGMNEQSKKYYSKYMKIVDNLLNSYGSKYGNLKPKLEDHPEKFLDFLLK